MHNSHPQFEENICYGKITAYSESFNKAKTEQQ